MSEYRVIEGSCIDVLATLDAGTVQTCITSPPYYGLRDYGHDGQIGLEPTPEEYVANLVAVFREVRRVLRGDGTLWLNLGDSYASGGPGGASPSSTLTGGGGRYRDGSKLEAMHNAAGPSRKAPAGLKPKDLLGIPWMVAFALRADGWYLRSDIIWSKPNPMPESVTDRPTKAHEYLFLLAKSQRYYYDAEAIKEPATYPEGPGNVQPVKGALEDPEKHRTRANLHLSGAHETRNKRTVWTVTSQPFPGAHFATFPPKLIEPCILAGSSPQACEKCGAPWQRVTEGGGTVPVYVTGKNLDNADRNDAGRTQFLGSAPRTIGWEPTCGHDHGSGRSTVLDPFNGAGTTGLVALRHDRDYVGIELNPQYAQMARNRIYDDGPLLNVEAA